MVDLVQSLMNDGVDLYKVLEFSSGEDPTHITITQVKKQYRRLALKYHPDKNKDVGTVNLDKFHLLSAAVQVLGDDSMRQIYDSWYKEMRVRDEHRDTLISKLNKRENQSKLPNQLNSNSIQDIQNYGEKLRKVKYFKMPYGDWKTPGQSNDIPRLSSNLQKDSSTLRVEIEMMRGTDLLDINVLKPLLRETIPSADINGLTYSSNNNPQDSTIVVYVEFKTPFEAHKVWKQWKQTENTLHLVDISPMVPISYYKNFVNPYKHDKTDIELDPEILKHVEECSTIILD